MLTLNGSEDHLVRIQGLPYYKPPLPFSAEEDPEVAVDVVEEALDGPKPENVDKEIAQMEEYNISVHS